MLYIIESPIDTAKLVKCVYFLEFLMDSMSLRIHRIKYKLYVSCKLRDNTNNSRQSTINYNLHQLTVDFLEALQ